MSVYASLFVAAALLSSVHAQFDLFGQYRSQIRQAVTSCSQQAGVDPSTLMESFQAGNVQSEWACIYRCIMQNAPGQLMDEEGTITLPDAAPAATVQCVNDSTEGVTDQCDKALRAANCWVSTRSQIFQGIRSFFLG